MTLIFAVAVALLIFRPQIARWLHRVLIDPPARKLPETTPGAILLLVLVVLTIAGAIAIARSDGLMMLSQSVPEGIGWFVSFDIATYLDAIALAWLLGATLRLRAVYAALKRWLAGLVLPKRIGNQHRRGKRARRDRRKSLPPSRDDEPAWPVFAFT